MSEAWTDSDCLDELMVEAATGELDEVSEIKLDEATFTFPAIVFACANRNCTRLVQGRKVYRSTEIEPVEDMVLGECLLKKEKLSALDQT